MLIRKMESKDKTAVIEMMRVFYNSPAVMTNGSEEIFANDVDACVSDDPYAEGYVFEAETGELAGYSMLAKSYSTEFGKKCIWIEDIYVKEEYRSRGIGKAFFNTLFSLYRDVIFRLEAEKENEKAIHLYENCGFENIPYTEMIKK